MDFPSFHFNLWNKDKNDVNFIHSSTCYEKMVQSLLPGFLVPLSFLSTPESVSATYLIILTNILELVLSYSSQIPKGYEQPQICAMHIVFFQYTFVILISMKGSEAIFQIKRTRFYHKSGPKTSAFILCSCMIEWFWPHYPNSNIIF